MSFLTTRFTIFIRRVPAPSSSFIIEAEIDRSTELSIGVASIAGRERNVMTVAFCHPSRLVFNPLSVIQTCRPAIQSSRPLFLRNASRRRQAQSQCHRTTVHAAQNAPHGRTTVGAVIIGNEILNGKTIDKNLSTLAVHVESYGAVLEQAVTIRDDVDIIAEHVRQMSSAYDLVFTSGGIGPTLDDVTYAGVAAAFNLSLDRHAETIGRMKQSRPDFDLNTARLRMAELPVDCDVLWTPDLWVPLAVVRNVYVLPGIPKLFHRMLMSVPTQRFGTRERRAKKVVLCEMAEGDLAELLESVAEQYDVSLGSYPATTPEARERYKSMITLEGDETDIVDQAAELIRVGVNGRYEQV